MYYYLKKMISNSLHNLVIKELRLVNIYL